ncbi:MAG: hypothetical protein ACOC2Z_09745 [Coleofasciculus sp.]
MSHREGCRCGGDGGREAGGDGGDAGDRTTVNKPYHPDHRSYGCVEG